MKTKSIYLLFAIALLFVQCSGGGDEPDPTPETQRLRGSWSRGWPNLFHDGETVISDNFIVYSDKSSMEWRQELSEIAEASFTKLKTNLNIQNRDLDFISTQSDGRIHILTNFDQWNIALAYRDGIIVRSKDGPNFFGDHSTWQKVFDHEITHVLEFLLIGNPSNSQKSTVWMREGFGNYGASNHKIQTMRQVNDWIEKMKSIPGGGHPINIGVWGDFPSSVTSGGTTGEYYAFFELAVRYLVDEEKGNGTNIENLKDYFDDLGTTTISQTVAFQKNFGISLAEFKQNFWTLMEEYLSN